MSRGWRVGVVREEFEQAVFEDLQFAQGAVGADDADAVVQRGGFVGQGEGLQAVLQAVEEAVGQGGLRGRRKGRWRLRFRRGR